MLYRVCWTCWALGATLVLLSRCELVSADVGWTGFYVASVAAVLTYLRWHSPAPPARAATVLTRDMIAARSHAYEQAIERYRQGEPLFYETFTCVLGGNHEVCLFAAASRPAADMDDLTALQDAERTVKAFTALVNAAPEIGSITADRNACVVLMSEFGERGFEVCRVTGSQVEWKARGKG